MLKIIPRQVHAMLDYSWGAAIAVAPKLMDFEDETAGKLLRATGLLTGAASLLTKYELGAVKVIPYRVHLMFDGLSAAVGLASPWLFGFAGNKKARNTALAFFAVEAVVVLLSQTDEA
jgi:hypothetical protein